MGVDRQVKIQTVNIWLYHDIRIFLRKSLPVGHGVLIIKDSRSNSDTPQSVELLWTSDQPDEETCT